MRVATAELESTTPYSQSKAYEVPKLERETPEEYEIRTWRERCHYDKDGNIFMPNTAFKNALVEATAFTPRKGPTGKNSTWAKNFTAGTLVIDCVKLPIKKDQVAYERLFVPSDGKRGGGRRVWKYFPLISEWKGKVEYLILDDSINENVFKDYLTESGMFIGVGRFRPRNNGFYGRFKVNKITWTNRQ
jgi:hypothetical protein